MNLEVFDKFKKAQEQYTETTKELTQPLKEFLLKTIKSYPELRAITWKQSSNVYNDGDSTGQFYVYDVQVSFVGLNSTDLEDDEEAYEALEKTIFGNNDVGYEDELYIGVDGDPLYVYSSSTVPKGRVKEMMTCLNKKLCEASDLLEEAFGDDAEVTILNNGQLILTEWDPS